MHVKRDKVLTCGPISSLKNVQIDRLLERESLMQAKRYSLHTGKESRLEQHLAYQGVIN